MLTIETFCDHSENANTYLVIQNHEALIIDPANDEKILKKYIGTNKVLGILLTHGHYDHFKSLEAILKDYNVPCYLHKKAKDKIFDLNKSYALSFGKSQIPKISNDVFRFVNDLEEIKLGSFSIKVLYTPGHTDCSVCYLIDEVMFSGDTLFKNTVGRSDLLTGNILKLKASIERLKKLSIDYQVYPGHDENTTLFYEQKNNPYFK